MFWSDCRFEPADGWEELQPLFATSRDAWLSHDMQAARAADQAIHAKGLVLIPDDGGEPITEFVVRIQGSVARLKCLAAPYTQPLH